ncbi:hypothetical protein MCOR25_003163 [Pyricularia grisea]|uniref:OPA3-like protein n=1 Tax=Pyricularia grisea TaxID=148305 RepID=A0A6P8B408_PYRGI|nr:hypothetical protein PgNI_06373 [Pyricularia grisea]KAI6374374.1 hypothetical protein MCOR25_003163 [Pyricularia grisea]TLD10008.1 hypothetical protein PgNI_06373 [Pyricularia grisea]
MPRPFIHNTHKIIPTNYKLLTFSRLHSVLSRTSPSQGHSLAAAAALPPSHVTPTPRHYSSSGSPQTSAGTPWIASVPKAAMVPLPLFKLASLFVRHVSKYGANRIKIQAHDHPRFRAFAAKYGQVMHQINMRLSVASMRNIQKELKAKDKAEAPTVKTKEQAEKEEAVKAAGHQHQHVGEPKKSIWRRKFRPLPEEKAVDLFADVIGDTFILAVACALIIYEYQRSSAKPDANTEKIKELTGQLEELKKRGGELEEEERKQAARIQTLEEALRNYKDPKTKQPLLPLPTAPVS